jgi:hypothetical protein
MNLWTGIASSKKGEGKPMATRGQDTTPALKHYKTGPDAGLIRRHLARFALTASLRPL